MSDNVSPEKIQMLPLSVEGSIMLATTPITGTAAMVQLARLLRKWLKSGQIKNDEETKILILSGSHGTKAGLSVLSDIKLADYTLYTRDCMAVGFCADEEITDVNAERKERLTLQESFINLEEFNKMTFQVLNMEDYHMKEEKLVEDIKAFQPTVLCVAFCFSLMSDVTVALRAGGVSAVLVIEEELRRVTGRPDLKLNTQQVELIKKWTDRIYRTLILCGGPGTGKTILACQALQIRLSQLKREGKKVKLFVTTWKFADVLNEKLGSHYLAAVVEDVNIMKMRDLCRDLKVEWDEDTPQTVVNHVSSALSANYSDHEIVLLCDEVSPCSVEAEPDWIGIRTRDNVNLIIALQPRGSGQDKPIEIQLPVDSTTLACQLDRNHRNSASIRQFYKWYRDHYWTKSFLSMKTDVELADSELPPGPKPIWLQCPENTSEVEILEHVSKMEEMQPYTDIMVISKDRAARAWCEERENWRGHNSLDLHGSECQACVTIDWLGPEYISRAANLLVLVTTWRDSWLESAAAHSSPDHECEELQDCPYRGTQLLDKRVWPGGDGVREEESGEGNKDEM